jgi:putative ABC transport system substrate-binding protein
VTSRRAFLGTLAGGLLAAPLAAQAQQTARPFRIVSIRFIPGSGEYLFDAFRNQLRQLGYAEGQNIVVEVRQADGQVDRLSKITAEIVQSKPDVIVVGSPQALLAAKQATATIPIVFAAIINPVGAGFVASLPRPGGNVTGVSWDATPELGGKQLELLREIVPRASRIAVLWNPDTAGSAAFVQDTSSAAQTLGILLQSVEVRAPEDLQAAFAAAIKQRVAGVVVLGSAFTYNHRAQIALLAAQHRIPAIYGNRDSVAAGGLTSYGSSLLEQWRRAAVYVDKILKGAKPADLPVEQPTKFELVINLKTAKALGLTIPQSLLLRADEVIQ